MLPWTQRCMHLFKLVFCFLGVNAQEWTCWSSGSSVFNFLRNRHTVSIAPPPICHPTNSAPAFSCLYILTTSYLLSFWQPPFWQVWGDTSLWCWYPLAWWLVTGHLYVLFGKMPVRVFCPFSEWVCGVVGVPCEFWISWCIICKYLLLYRRQPSCSIDRILHCAKAFFFWCSLIYLCSWIPYLRRYIQK